MGVMVKPMEFHGDHGKTYGKTIISDTVYTVDGPAKSESPVDRW